MKKLVLFFAAALAVSFASCGNKAAQSEETTATEAEAVEVVVEEPAVAEEVAEAEEMPVEEVVAPAEEVAAE
jgi:hypothetical protein